MQASQFKNASIAQQFWRIHSILLFQKPCHLRKDFFGIKFVFHFGA
jgi:hypothetical protein